MDRYEKIIRMIREARLELPPDEVGELARQVASLLDNVDVLASFEVEEGTERPAVTPEALRTDEPGETLARADAIENAPDSGDGYIAVPSVLPGGEES